MKKERYKDTPKIMEIIFKKTRKVYKYGNIFQIMEIDEKDLRIIKSLKEHSNAHINKISKETRIPLTTIHNREKKLVKEGIIKNYTINIDYAKIGKPIKSYVLITVNQNAYNTKKLSQEEICKLIKKVDGVESIDIVTGTTDIILQIRASSIENLNEIITNKIRNIPEIDKTQTLVVLKEVE